MRFKKPRKLGPSKNQKKVNRREHEGYAGSGGPSLQQAYPEVSNLTIRFSITSPQNELAKEETRRFSPGQAADLSCACPGTCGGVGTFDFAPKIGELVAAKLPEGEAAGACQVEGFGGIPQPCGYLLKCRIEITY